jgi:excisionase family DNA binding protein
MDKILCSKKESAEAIGCSVRTLENLINRKLIESRRVGRRRMIPRVSLERFAKHDTPIITGKDSAAATR